MILENEKQAPFTVNKLISNNNIYQRVYQKDVLQVIGMQGWWRQAAEKDELRRVLRETRTQKGL